MNVANCICNRNCRDMILFARRSLTVRITIDSDISHCKPTICGLRCLAEMILELFSSGMTTDEILAYYEDLEPEGIFAALEYKPAEI